MITKEQQKKIQSLSLFKNSIYNNLNIEKTILFYINRYVNTIKKIVNISECSAIDCGCGHGWFSFAYLLSGGRHITLVDFDVKRLELARSIASIINIKKDNISFKLSSIDQIKFNENQFDIFVSVETLEHIGREKVTKSLEKMNNITSKVVLLTTPNKYFPVIAHDTRIPFLHWLPIKNRKIIAKLFGKENSEHNYFLSPFDLNIFKNKFNNITSCLSFLDYNDFLLQYPLYLPYGSNNKYRYYNKPSFLKRNYYKYISKIFKTRSYFFMPSLTTVFVNKKFNQCKI